MLLNSLYNRKLAKLKPPVEILVAASSLIHDVCRKILKQNWKTSNIYQ